jgi:hypothetical protein
LKNDEIKKKTIKFLKLFEIKQIVIKKIMNMFEGKKLKDCFEKI